MPKQLSGGRTIRIRVAESGRVKVYEVQPSARYVLNLIPPAWHCPRHARWVTRVYRPITQDPDGAWRCASAHEYWF